MVLKAALSKHQVQDIFHERQFGSTRALHNKLHVFVNKCLRHILGVHWPNVISNEELLRRTNMESIVTSLKHSKWRWIGHTLRRESNNVARQALHYHPQGKRKVRRPRNNWTLSMLQELERAGYSWEKAKALTMNGVR